MTRQKTLRLCYWASTGVFCFFMLYAAYTYLTDERMREGFTHLGYPSYFRLELAVAKILGVAALLLPCPAKLKEWAYAGFTFTLISAFIAHLSSGDDASRFMMPVVMGAILYASYVCLQKLGRNNLF
ncbi:MAG TPA: DoxX family protein [bacterium]|jgi:hypothetical protein|nr:DoxX family protein [bacterium]